MARFRSYVARLAAFFHRSRTEAELDEEIRFHLDMETAENRRRGLAPREARRTARLRFGGVEAVKAACRDEARLPWLEILLQDALYALRRMARSPGLTTVAVLTLALGIGATSALWSVIDAVLVEPLPYPHPERLVSVVTRQVDGSWSLNTQSTFDYVRRNASSFEHVAASGWPSGINLAAGSEAEHVAGRRVTADYFAVLGVTPRLGRGFTRDEEQPGGAAVAVLSHGLWLRRFAGDPGVVGRAVTIGGEPHTVVGVMPEGFRPLPPAELWRPLRADFEGSGTNLQVIARLHPDTSLAQARSELEALSRRPERPSSVSEESPLDATLYHGFLAQGSRGALLVLLAAVGMLLAIACANVACLLLVEAAARRREIALRTAIGGGRGRLLHQLLTESALLGLAGGLLGVATAHWGVRALLALAPGDFDGWQIGVDLRVLGVTLVLSLATGLVFGLAPAFEATRGEPREALSEGGDRQIGGHRAAWTRRFLVVAEIALSVVLLVGAALLVRTFRSLRHVELGFEPAGVVTAQMSFEGEGYAGREWFTALYERSLEDVRRLPGVERAAVASAVPVARPLNLPVRVPGSPTYAEKTSVGWCYVTPDYFELLGIPLVAGRLPDAGDTAAAAPIAVVNQTFVRRFFPGESVLGQEIEIDFLDVATAPRIVGVVGDVRTFGLRRDPWPMMYVPLPQVAGTFFQVHHRWFDSHWLVRLRPGAASPIPGIRQAVRSIDPTLPFSGFHTMDEVISGSLVRERFQAVLLAVFAALALVMAAAGLFGILSYGVVQRRREIGVRMALGATWADALRLVVREGLGLAAVGIALGCAGALAFARALESFVFGVSPTEPAVYAGIAAGFLAVALAASAVPGLKAVRLDPATTLRQE